MVVDESTEDKVIVNNVVKVLEEEENVDNVEKHVINKVEEEVVDEQK